MKKTFHLAPFLFFVFSLFFLSCKTTAQEPVKDQPLDLSLYQKRWLVQAGDTLPYRVLLPEGFDSSKQYPVVFFLHGAGERGRDNERQLTHGAKLFLQAENRNAFPAIVVFPQCARESYWSNVLRVHDDKGARKFEFLADGNPTRSMQLLQELVPFVLRSYPVKRTQVYVGGLSMGGMGTYELVRRLPGTFAAAFAICGGAHPATASKLKGVDWWLFHGGKDDVVPPQATEVIHAALKKAGAGVKFTLYPNANHNSWDPAFAEKELLPWLFSKRKR
ncbi:MAG: phospholipase [Chitinophagaceae bacterium]|nr:MAG: phospholipase [Chitinophagaceae bacterium]